MTNMETKNAQIDSTMLGFEGHGILTYQIYLNYGGSTCQGFGGIALDGKKEEGDNTDYCTKTIKELLTTIGVEKWEDLIGKHIRVKIGDDGRIKSYGHLLDDKWTDI